MASAFLLRRPRERRDRYAVSSRFGAGADAFFNNEGQGLWVPAFAGTTRGEFGPHSSHHIAAAAYWTVRSSRTMTVWFGARLTSIRRPGERRDRYAVPPL